MLNAIASRFGITLIGAAPIAPGVLSRALDIAPMLVAADGGADNALRHGVTPDAVIGDFDSLSDVARATLPPDRLHHLPGQDDTDFDKVLSLCDAPFFMAVGFTGARLDHTLAGMSTLVRHPHKRVILDTGDDLCMVLPARLTLDLPAGTRVSLFPLGPVGATSQGLTWPLDGLSFDPCGRIGTSNRVDQTPVILSAEGPAMLLILPPEARAALLSALTDAPVWPADARGR
ncbi:MAG: thiamine diphosphokinase [Paracoccaceae bacterium]